MKRIFLFNRETLSFEKPKKKTYAYITCGVGLLLTIGWFTGTNTYIINKINHTTEVTDTMLVHGEKFSEKSLIRLLKDCHIKYPYIVLAQAKLESGNFTSKLFKNNSNMFGMRLAKQRVTTALGEKNEYAHYRDWIDCVHDYGMWSQIAVSHINSEDEYFTKLSERYAEDSTYVIKLKNIIKKENLKNTFYEE